MVTRFLVIFALAFGVASCGVKDDPLPRVVTAS